MYSWPVATMFCEKLLTRRDIAENLENQERVLFGSDLVLLESWWVCYSVLSRKVMVHRKVRRIQRSLHANTVWREIHLKIVFTSFESCYSKEKCKLFSWQFIWVFLPIFWSFLWEGNLQFPNARTLVSLPWGVLRLIWHRTLKGKQIGKWRRAMKISWSYHLDWSIRGVLRVRIPKVRRC